MAQSQLFKSQNQSQASYPPQRPVKDKVAKQIDVDLAQVVSQQAQLKEMAEDTNQTVHNIKQLLENMAVLPTQPTTRGQSSTEGLRVEQQVVKATVRGNATSTRRANSQQVI